MVFRRVSRLPHHVAPSAIRDFIGYTLGEQSALISGFTGAVSQQEPAPFVLRSTLPIESARPGRVAPQGYRFAASVALAAEGQYRRADLEGAAHDTNF